MMMRMTMKAGCPYMGLYTTFSEGTCNGKLVLKHQSPKWKHRTVAGLCFLFKQAFIIRPDC